MADTKTPKPAPTNCECHYWEFGPELDGSDPNVDQVPIYKTDCAGELTARRFVPGHDAKLKALFIRAGLAGHEVRRRDGVLSSMDVETAARRFGFGRQVLASIERRRKQVAAAEDRKARRQAEKADTKKSAGKAEQPPADAKADAEGHMETPVGQPEMPREVPVQVRQEQPTDTPTEQPPATNSNGGADALAQLPDGDQVTIKLGRYTYTAVVDGNGNAKYINGKGNLMEAAKGIFKLVK